MITIRTVNRDKDNNSAEIHIAKGTPHVTYLLGIEMLVESLLEQTKGIFTIDDVLADVKRIYLRDNPPSE